MGVKKVFKRQIGLELIADGFRCLYTEPNRTKQNFVVFCFEDTEQLQKKLTEINNRNKSVS